MGKLIKYELRKNLGMLIAMLTSIGAVELYFLASLAMDKDTHVAVATVLMPIGCLLIALMVFILGVSSYSRELSQKSSYLIFMTPHSTLAIVASKVLYTVVLGVGFAALLGGLLVLDMPLVMDYFGEWRGFTMMLDNLLGMQSMSLAGFLFTALFFALTAFCHALSLVGLAYLSITLSATLLQNSKGRWVLSVAFFLLLAWLNTRLGSLWSYDVYSADTMLDTLDGALRACLPGLLQALGVLLVSVFGSAWLLDRYVSL